MIFDPDVLVNDMRNALEGVIVSAESKDVMRRSPAPLDRMLRAVADGGAMPMNMRGSLCVHFDHLWCFNDEPDDPSIHDYDDEMNMTHEIKTWATPSIRADVPEAARHVAAAIAYRDIRTTSDTQDADRIGRELFEQIVGRIGCMPEALAGGEVLMRQPSPAHPYGDVSFVGADGTEMRPTRILLERMSDLPNAVSITEGSSIIIQGWSLYERIPPICTIGILRRISEKPEHDAWFTR